jgi:hypothetical protein
VAQILDRSHPHRRAALRWLTRAEQLIDPRLADMLAEWELDPIRNESGFKAIEARLDFPP